MATRITQIRILGAALDLFNEKGTGVVSTKRIAERCGISKGNLQYHFATKRDIVFALFEMAIREMDENWYQDHLAPTLDHMAEMFVRQLNLILKYRFFYRELADLLRRDPRLRLRFAHNRERRLQALERFMRALANRGLMRLPADARCLRSIVDVTWIVSENWLNYAEYHDREVNATIILDGYYEIVEVLRPYLCIDPRQAAELAFPTFVRLTWRGAAGAPPLDAAACSPSI
ncbi:MAG TPA: TetR/AcrR family transcriptional regulator [Steroidobacteraceae bacterium]|nr:TetR/AcrR family transcriptional regulator [Steroidobacteraceae bacterium]